MLGRGDTGQLKRGERHLPRNRGVVREKNIQAFARFQAVKQVLQGNPGADEYRHPSLNFRVAVNDSKAGTGFTVSLR